MIWGSAGFLIGAVLGSLSKALADRSLNDKSFWGRSYCPRCKHNLAWYDLFPIFSFILLRGRCRYCHKKIGIEYLLVELAAGVLIGFLLWQQSDNLNYLISPPAGGVGFLNSQFVSFLFKASIFVIDLISKIFFITVLVILFITDFKKMFIPDRITLPAVLIGIILGFLITVLRIGFLYYSLSQSAIGRLLLPPSSYFYRHVLINVEPFIYSILIGAAIAGFFLVLIIITRGKGMGGGDVKLGALMGIFLGFPNALFALILSFLTGAIFSIFLLISGKKHFGQTIPFGPFLVLGSLIMLFWGNQIVNWYLHIGR